MTTMRLYLLVAAASLLTATPAFAQTANPRLREGIRLFEDFEYAAALEQLAEASGATGNTPAENLQIALWSGLTRMELGDEAGAEADFTAAFTLDPNLELPAGASPKVKLVFERARQKLGLAAPIKIPPPPPVIPKPTPAAVTEPDPLEASRAPPAQTAEPESVPPEALGGKAPATVASSPISNRLVAYALMGAGVALAGSGAFFGVKSSGSVDSAKEAHFQAETVSHLDTARSQALTANVLYGAATGAAIGGLIALFMGGDDAPAPASAAAEAPGAGAPVPPQHDPFD